MISYSKFTHKNEIPEYSYVRPLSKEYKVLVNGEEAPVYTCRISKFPFNTIWPGHQRTLDQTDEVSFVNIVSDEEVNIEVIANIEHKRVLIKPYSKNVKFEEKNGKISFTLKENGGYVLECDSYHHALYIFNSKPIPAPKKEDVTYYFDAGIHFPGKITLKSNESVYVDKDALVYGCIYAEKADNIKIFGNGILDDSHEERTGNYCYENYTNGNIKFYECNNIEIKGVGITNSAIWCLNAFACTNVHIDDIKIFGQWRYNTDGIDIVNCQNVFIKNSFVHSFDDTITIKGIDRYCYIDNVNIHIDNCVLWCDWGNCCEIGIETLCREYKDISFRNCDIVRGGCVAMDISNGECAEVHDITFENINVEYNSFDTREVYQSSDDMKYDAQDICAIPVLVYFKNNIWRTKKMINEWGLPASKDNVNLEGIKPRHVRDIKVENINVYYDEGVPLLDGKPNICIVVKNQEGTEEFENISIKNIYVNGKKFD